MEKDKKGNLLIYIIISALNTVSNNTIIECNYCDITKKVYYKPCKDNNFSGLYFDYYYNIQNTYKHQVMTQLK